MVERVFEQLQLEMGQFQQTTGLACLAGCGHCCTTPKIEASPIEFLPWAFQIFLDGKAMEVLQKLDADPGNLCYNFKGVSLAGTLPGSCGAYQHRGLICRLFGFAAVRDKMGQYRLSTCKIIKENQPEGIQKAAQLISSGGPVPIYMEYYERIFRVVPKYAHQLMPINKALKLALEEVLHHYAYRPFPYRYRKAG